MKKRIFCLLSIAALVTAIVCLWPEQPSEQTKSSVVSASASPDQSPGDSNAATASTSTSTTSLSSPPVSTTSATPAIPGSKSGKPWLDIPEWRTLSPREKLVRLLKQPFGIQDRGTVRVLEVARDELYLRHLPNTHARLTPIEKQADIEGLLREAGKIAATSGHMPQLVLYPPHAEKRSERNRWIVSDQVLLQAVDASRAIDSAKHAGLNDAQAMSAAPGFVLGTDNRFPGAALITAADLDNAQGVKDSRPMLAYQMAKRFVPTDPLFTKQWHLKNTGTVHLNVSGVWDTNKGTGIKVAVIDDGLQIAHPDLSPNVDNSVPTLHRDYNDDDDDPSPNAVLDDPQTTDVNEAEDGDNHGTSCAGLLAAAAGNSIGGVGVAPEAKLIGMRLIAAPSTPAEEADAFGRRNDVIQIKSNSWGPPDGFPWILGWADPVVQTAWSNATTNGRGGLGTIFLFAAGNGRDQGDEANKDGYANNIHNFAVAALTSAGVPAYYSEFGANLMVSAPADGVTTTDLMGDAGYNPTQDSTPITQRDYTDEFNGTSAATPMVAGVVALILKSNPNLGWRDVAEILLRSSKKVSPTDTGWVSRTGGQPSLPLIKHNQKYGGGMADAGAAVALASKWINLGPRTSHISGTLTPPNPNIPDNNTTGIIASKDFSSDAAMRVEQVEVDVSIDHGYRGDLQIELISPSGVISTLASQSDYDDGDEDSDSFTPPVGYEHWVFTSNRHWGESSLGVWKVRVKDLYPGDTGTFNSCAITLHGVPASPASLSTKPAADHLVLAGTAKTFTAVATGYADLLFKWLKGTVAIAGATTTTYSIPSVTTAYAGTYSVVVSNLTGSDSSSFHLGVITPPPAATIFNVGTTITVSAATTLPTGITATYQWKKGGVDVVNDTPGLSARISGANTSKLTILKCQAGDEGNYECVVTMGTATLSSGISAVSIRYKPDIQLAAFPTDLIVSGAITPINLNIANSITKVVIAGLPSGLTYNTLTGIISGTPNVPVNNVPITITAYNLAGSTVKKINLTIAALDAKAVGTFDGTISRSAATGANHNFGGSLTTLVVASTGTFSGKVYLEGLLPYTVTGRLAASTSSDPAATVLIKRTSPLPNLTFAFSINRTNGKLTGTLVDAASTFTLNVDAFRRTPNTAVGARQNFWLDPATAVSSSAAPGGACAGYAIVTGTTGAATVTMKLADGTVITKATSRGENGDVPFFAMLYTNRGSILGSLVISDQTAPAYDTVTGTFTWLKNVVATDKLYASGFDFGVTNSNTLSALGSEYRKATAPAIFWGIPDVAVGLVNAKVTLAGAGIENSAFYIASNANINHPFRISTAYAVTQSLPNPAVVVCTTNSLTGEVSGTMVLQDNTPVVKRTVVFYGVIGMAHSRGRGWFTLPQLPVTTSQAGSLDFGVAP